MAGGKDAGRQKEAGGRQGPQDGRPKTRVQNLVIRRQATIYYILMGLGAALIYMSDLKNIPIVTEGAAFIAIGAVGLIMSRTTQDIGQGIKEAVREDGEKTREGLREVKEAVEKVGASVEAMAKDNRDFFRQMLEKQAGIQEEQSLLRKETNILRKEQSLILERMS